MSLMRAYRALGPVDLRNIRRDALLRPLFVAPVLIGLALRVLLPILSDQLLGRLSFDLRPHYPLITGFLIQVMPLLTGMVLGFLFLDQRDDGTLAALQVTPLALSGYLAYRLSLPVVISFAGTMVMVPLSGIDIHTPALILAALCAAPLAPLLALLYTSLAQNKVQGLAVMKASGIIMVPPLIAYFVRSGWEWVFGLVPTYWPVKVYWSLASGSLAGWPAMAAGLAYEVLLISLLLRWFNRAMHTGRV